jgi:hypothetical protein
MVVTAAKTQCKNNEEFFFSGKELSPLGLGYCAESINVGEQMNGRDGTLWVVCVKNGEKAWIRSPEKIGLEKEEPLATKKKVVEEIEFEEGHEYTNDENVTFVVKTVKNVKKWVKKPETKAKPKTKRGPSKYNLFIGRTLTRLRQEEKGLDTIVYMQKAIVIWKSLTQEEKDKL